MSLKGNWKRNILVLAFLSMICCVGFGLVSAWVSTEQDEAATRIIEVLEEPPVVEDSAIEPAEELPTLAPTAKPLATEKPTKKAAVKTATKTPRPRPTATEANAVGSEDMVFAAEAVGIFEVLEESTYLMVSQMTELSENPVLIFDTDWKADFLISLTAQMLAAESIRELEPGPLTRGAHREMLLMADDIDSYVYLLADFVDNQGQTSIDPAISRIESAQRHMENVTSEIQRVTDGLQ
jgi:hypothetical protein